MKFFDRKQMQVGRSFVHTYAMLFITFFFCAGVLAYLLVAGEREIDDTHKRITQTHAVITRAELIATHIEGMLAAQRGYIITSDKTFMDGYKSRREDVSKLVAELTDLISSNTSQSSRLEELRHSFNEFSTQLEERAEKFSPLMTSRATLENVKMVNSLKDNIIRINSDILEEEYRLLDQQITSVERKKSGYYASLATAFALLMLFHLFFLRSQQKRSHAETALKATEERFTLAIEGTRDGIFDWDLVAGKVFYSGRFFAMLGYDRGSFIGTIEDFKNLLHPEDAAQAWRHIELYLRKDLPGYSQDFRLKGADGRWIWINARGKAVFDAIGNPLRLVGAHSDITHVKEAEERLMTEKMQAEESNRAKSDFLAHMSHEIRTPLTAISGVGEIFEKRKKDFADEKQKTLVDTLNASVAVLKDLINDVLDFSKIESRELELDNSFFDLNELFDKVTAMMSIRAQQKRLAFTFDYKNMEDMAFYGDAVRLRQILINLISNAIKFTEKGGVTIKAYKETREGMDFMRVDVTDTGIGIAAENFDLIFERFKQADASVSRKYGGTGLGLPISRNLARLMGGDVLLDSTPGKGSTFSIVIPLTATEKASGNPRLSKDFIEKLTASVGEKKVLLVEDYEGNVVVLSYILDDLECGYDVAKTGKEAVKLWQENRYNLILMDIQMPEMDGLTATKLIREQESQDNTPRTPIIGMTAHALIGDKDKCIAVGMDAYLPKPIIESQLRKEILKYLGDNKKAA